jgi:hypothetical protein
MKTVRKSDPERNQNHGGTWTVRYPLIQNSFGATGRKSYDGFQIQQLWYK